MNKPIKDSLRTNQINDIISRQENPETTVLVDYIKQLEALLEISFDLYPKEKIVIENIKE